MAEVVALYSFSYSLKTRFFVSPGYSCSMFLRQAGVAAVTRELKVITIGSLEYTSMNPSLGEKS